MSVRLDDPRVILTSHKSQMLIHSAIENGFVDVVAIILAHFPLANVHTADLIGMAGVRSSWPSCSIEEG